MWLSPRASTEETCKWLSPCCAPNFAHCEWLSHCCFIEAKSLGVIDWNKYKLGHAAAAEDDFLKASSSKPPKGWLSRFAVAQARTWRNILMHCSGLSGISHCGNVDYAVAHSLRRPTLVKRFVAPGVVGMRLRIPGCRSGSVCIRYNPGAKFLNCVLSCSNGLLISRRRQKRALRAPRS